MSKLAIADELAVEAEKLLQLIRELPASSPYAGTNETLRKVREQANILEDFIVNYLGED